MPIMNLTLNNVLAFDELNVNFSYPKKLTKSLIQDENLNTRPSFRYKKLNVFVGSNATGKTSLMKCIWRILLFLRDKEKKIIESIMNKNDKESKIIMDYALFDGFYSKLARVIISYYNDELKMAYKELTIGLQDSYESMVKTLDNTEFELVNYLECVNKINLMYGWNLTLPATEPGFDRVNIISEDNDYFAILNSVLKTLDPAIIDVRRSNDAKNAIVVEHENADIIVIQSGNPLSAIQKLSSGTKYGINLANIIYSIKHHDNGIYLIDEQFSYINSDIEASILATMVSLLGPNEQIFFTTHNENILDLGFPFHSYNFMRKKYENGKAKISVSCATEVENRNNVPVRSILDNDMLNTAPDVNKIYEIGEE